VLGADPDELLGAALTPPVAGGTSALLSVKPGAAVPPLAEVSGAGVPPLAAVELAVEAAPEAVAGAALVDAPAGAAVPPFDATLALALLLLEACFDPA
jgi:hypothetical protein